MLQVARDTTLPRKPDIALPLRGKRADESVPASARDLARLPTGSGIDASRLIGVG